MRVGVYYIGCSDGDFDAAGFEVAGVAEFEVDGIEVFFVTGVGPFEHTESGKEREFSGTRKFMIRFQLQIG